jgi:hypothetical protein
MNYRSLSTNSLHFLAKLSCSVATLWLAATLNGCGGPAVTSEEPSTETPGAGLSIPLVKGPFQNDGATPWYAQMGIGTPPQTLKIAIDTGNNFVWVTSTLCQASPEGCDHFGGVEFDEQASSTFQWDGEHPDKTVGFGPWGNMVVQKGRDVVHFGNGVTAESSLYLSKEYTGEQFAELDWDGGIGMPSGSDTVEEGFPFLFKELMDAGIVSREMPFLAFHTDPATQTGTVTLGQLDATVIDPQAYLFLPWRHYGSEGDLWATTLKSMKVGDQELASEISFSLDSGSSRFKGDVAILKEAFARTTETHDAVTLEVGESPSGDVGVLQVPAEIYMVEIEEGPGQGESISQFAPLEGLEGLVLVGSVLMDHLYTVYEYEVTPSADGYALSPVGMWIFNKRGGHPIIQNRQDRPARIFNAQ